MPRFALFIRTFIGSTRAAACLLGWAVLLPMVSAPLQAQILKLPHPDTTRGNFFGVAVAIDGNQAAVGASGETSCGVNGGAAYIFERDSTHSWQQAARIVADDCAAGDYFGRSLDLSGDRLIVAAARDIFNVTSTNAAYVFERDSTGAWHQSAKLESTLDVPEGAFATSVSLDGDRALITTSGDASNNEYGGAAYVFERDSTGTWHQVARLTGSKDPRRGIFGGNGKIEGDRAVVAASTYFAYEPGSVYIFERDPATGQWSETAHFGDIDDFFISLDLDGDRVLVGESKGNRRESGQATLFQRTDDGAWEHAETIRPATPYDHGAFGSIVALDGPYLLATGYDEQLRFDFNIDRVVYVFKQDPETGTWRQHHVADIGAVFFGTSIDLDGSYAVIGQASEGEPGAAYIVRVW